MFIRPIAVSTLFLIASWSVSACEGEGHELGAEDAGGLGDATGPDADATDRGPTVINQGCSPVGGESCMNGNEIVRCAGDHYETIETCQGQCLLFDQSFVCEGGARAFNPTNVGLVVDGAVRASISTVSGAIGCGLANDYELSPGLAAEQVYIILANVGFECPDGLYGLNASCDPEYPADSSARCAIYRRWTENRLEAVEALSGAVTITTVNASTCRYQVDLSIAGQQQTVRFTAPIGGGNGGPRCLNPE